MQIVEITTQGGEIAEPLRLAQAEAVHRELRDRLEGDYPEKMRRVFAGGGRMIVAVDADRVVGVAVYRVFENTFDGLHLYVDDIVTTEAQRSKGVGHALLAYLEEKARYAGCTAIKLDSGTQRRRAHAFYFREGYAIYSFHFAKGLA